MIKKYTSNHMLKAKDGVDFKIGRKATLIGWLLELYLYPEDKDGYIPVSSKFHRDNYNKALSVLRKHAGLTTKEDLLEWEKSISISQSATILNKIVRDMKK